MGYNDYGVRPQGTGIPNRTFADLVGFEDEYFAYTFTGKVTQRQHVHSAPGKTTQTEVYTNAYDHAGRLFSVTHKLNSAAAVTLSQNTYDEIGRMLTKKLTAETSTKVTDAATAAITYYGAFQFTDGANVTTEYIYDKNGNLKKDYNKKIVDIQYNSLNLPDGLQFTNGNTVNYVYNAAGQKLSVHTGRR